MDFAPPPAPAAANLPATGISSSDGPVDSGSMRAPRLNASDSEPAAPAPSSGATGILADDLIRGLKKAGYKPKFLAANAPIPDDGLLLTGVFTQKSADGILHRAAVGQGQPAADVELYLTTASLLRNVKPLYEPVDKSAADSAGAAIRLNPEVATLKFSLAGNSDAKAVKKLADQIVAELVRLTLQAEAQGLSGSGDPINQYSKP
jgi:hypothetical protein